MSTLPKEYPEVYIYMGESIDGKGTGDLLRVPESRPGVIYYFKNEYSFGAKSILMGRTTYQEFIGNKEIDYTGITGDNIEIKDYLSENRKKTDYYYISIDKNGIRKMKCYPAFFGEATREEMCMVNNLVNYLNKQDLFKNVENKVNYDFIK